MREVQAARRQRAGRAVLEVQASPTGPRQGTQDRRCGHRQRVRQGPQDRAVLAAQALPTGPQQEPQDRAVLAAQASPVICWKGCRFLELEVILDKLFQFWWSRWHVGAKRIHAGRRRWGVHAGWRGGAARASMPGGAQRARPCRVAREAQRGRHAGRGGRSGEGVHGRGGGASKPWRGRRSERVHVRGAGGAARASMPGGAEEPQARPCRAAQGAHPCRVVREAQRARPCQEGREERRGAHAGRSGWRFHAG